MWHKLFILSLVVLPVAVANAEGDHKHDFADDVAAFHHVLSPLWHAPASAERSANVCKKTNELVSLAKGIKSQNASSLVTHAELLNKECAQPKADVEKSFSALHDAFHALIEQH